MVTDHPNPNSISTPVDPLGWGSGKSLLVAMFARQAVVAAPMIRDMMKIAISGEMRGELPPVSEWIRLYKAPDEFMENIFVDTLRLDGISREVALEDYRALKRLVRFLDNAKKYPKAYTRRLASWFKNTPAEMLAEWANEAREAWGDHNEEIRNALNESEIELPDCADEIFNGIYFQFFARVTIPCLGFYAQPPHVLLGKASDGDHDAFAKLYRIDKAVIHEPTIAQWTWELSQSEPRRYSRLLKSANNIHPYPPTQQEIKTAVGALILELFSASKHSSFRLNVRELRELFDSVESARRNERGARDAFLPEANEALRKAMYRKRPAMRQMIQWDK